MSVNWQTYRRTDNVRLTFVAITGTPKDSTICLKTGQQKDAENTGEENGRLKFAAQNVRTGRGLIVEGGKTALENAPHKIQDWKNAAQEI